MFDEEILHAVALSLLPQVGAVTARKLIAYSGSLEAIFKQNAQAVAKIPGISNEGARKITSTSVMDDAKREIDFMIKHHIKPILYTSDVYPHRLNACNDGPILLYTLGDVDWNRNPCLAIIGTRKPTPQGIAITEAIVKDALTAFPNIIIISGLAYGIDISAHKSCLKNGGKTVAVLGHGLNTIYPIAHKKIAGEITRQGTLITEFPICRPIDKTQFVRRNRIVAGMSDAVLVVESGESGGAMITSEIAFSYDRDVFAIPGRIHDERSQGCLNLIKKQKASLITSFQDIADAMNWGQQHAPRQIQLFHEMNEEEKRIHALLVEYNMLSIDELAHLMNEPGNALLSKLLTMEFNGQVIALPGKIFKPL